MGGVELKLKEESIKWAIQHIYKESDTDLFPKPIEIEILYSMIEKVVDRLKDVDLGNYTWNAARRFIIPKTNLSYRLATQLDPIDSIMLSAIIYEFGMNVENKRRPTSENRVFNYRFSPSADGYLYNRENVWNNFWTACKEKIKRYEYAVYLDISDFYNQIYHHVIQNQLIYCGFPNEVNKSIMALLESLTQKVSRGIPIGPHSAHLLAEMALIPIDDSLVFKGYEFCRFADDIIVFSNDIDECSTIIYEMAEILDKQQRLILQNQKTRIYTKPEFVLLCDNMLNDSPISDEESDFIKILKKYSIHGYGGTQVTSITIEEADVKMLTKEKIEDILNTYLFDSEPKYTKIRWLYRKFSRLGLPSAIEYSIKNVKKLMPAISDICQYFISVANKANIEMFAVGEDVLNLLDNKVVKSNEFLQISLLSLFAHSRYFNHTDKLIRLYRTSSENIKRKIILSAYTAGADAWIRELKEDYPRLDIWNRRALIIACSLLPAEEKKFYIGNLRQYSNTILENLLLDWVRGK